MFIFTVRAVWGDILSDTFHQVFPKYAAATYSASTIYDTGSSNGGGTSYPGCDVQGAAWRPKLALLPVALSSPPPVSELDSAATATVIDAINALLP